MMDFNWGVFWAFLAAIAIREAVRFIVWRATL